MKWIYKTLPWFFLGLFGIEIIAVMMPKRDGEFHVREFARLPVLLGGRIQPFDSMARKKLRNSMSLPTRTPRDCAPSDTQSVDTEAPRRCAPYAVPAGRGYGIAHDHRQR